MKSSAAFKKIILLILLLSACAGPTPKTSAAPTPIDTSLRLAEAARLAEKRQYSAALALLQEAAWLDPSKPTAPIAMGHIYLKQHRWTPAQKAFEQALAIQSDNYTAAVGLAEALLEQGAYIQSRNVWRRAIELEESRPEAWVGLGRAYLTALDYREAERAFAEALSRASNPQALWFLAALSLPADVAAGKNYLKQIAPPTSKSDYLLATLESLPPNAPRSEAAALPGVALLQLGELELAHKSLLTASQLQPENAKTWAFLGRAQAQLGLPALEAFNQATNLDPNLALAPYFQGIYLRRQGLYDLAIEYFLNALDLDPGNLAVALEMALTLAEKGDYLSAEAWYRSVVEAEPDSAEYQQLLVEFYVNRSYRIAENGLVEAERLLELAPASSDAYDLLGWARYQSGDFTGAEESLHQAVALDPAKVSVRYHLGKTLEALGKNIEAQAEFTHVLDWDASGAYRERVKGAGK